MGDPLTLQEDPFDVYPHFSPRFEMYGRLCGTYSHVRDALTYLDDASIIPRKRSS